MKHYYLVIFLFCILSHSCSICWTLVNQESIKVHSTNKKEPFLDVELQKYTKHPNGKWGSAKCVIKQDFDNWNNIFVNKENIKICKSGKYLKFKLYAFNIIKENAYYISNSDYYMDNSSPLFIQIKERLNFGDSLSIEEYNLPYKGDTIHIDIKLPNYPKEDRRGRNLISGDS